MPRPTALRIGHCGRGENEALDDGCACIGRKGVQDVQAQALDSVDVASATGA